jgi:hypothetical protein
VKMAAMEDFSDDETGESFSAGNACGAACPEYDGTCALELGHLARHCCGTDTSHRWSTEMPA